MPSVRIRAVPDDALHRLVADGVPPVLARVYAARGIDSADALNTALEALEPPHTLRHAQAMARLLADAIAARKKLAIIADYDADGATACAVGIRAIRAMGGIVDYLVPDRFRYGYGLTPEIVAVAKERLRPDVLVTVDNGIASVEGVAEANRLGMTVLITDHHLPGEHLPDAACIVNPNQPGCGFASKNLAGVGVMFYVMLALRAELRSRGAFGAGTGPHLGALLDFVALGTVADVVPLDRNNRILVDQGLRRIRAGHAHCGIAALLATARREPVRASTFDLAFLLGPRLNAAGRLDDMSIGIECLLSDDPARAATLSAELDRLNRERRAIESDMRESALAAIDRLAIPDQRAISLYDAGWHQGVIGIVAARIKDRFYRPVFAFAPGNDGEIKGSGRSIAGFHLRDALDLVAKRHPGLIIRFGGHAAAAGVTIREQRFEAFRRAFDDVASSLMNASQLERRIETDGPLPVADTTVALARDIGIAVWGQGFPEPLFQDRFAVESQRVVGDRHTRLRLRRDGRSFGAMLFNDVRELPSAISAVYRLGVDDYGGRANLALTIEHWAEVGASDGV